MDKEEEKGLNKDFGFEIGRPFYIMSRMHMNRVIAYQGGNNLYIKNLVENHKDFKWVFDGTSKTIKSYHQSNLPSSLSIMSNGSNQRVSCQTTNARWW